MFDNFKIPGKASFLLGGQWGSEGKGAAAASVAYQLSKQLYRRDARFDVVTTNAGAQAGHTSTHGGTTRVVFHLPTAGLIAAELGLSPSLTYLNAGSIIDPEGLEREIEQQRDLLRHARLVIHPNAAVITQGCRDAENMVDSAQTRIASTRKGVGEALARKVLRSGETAKDHPYLKQFVKRIDLNQHMRQGDAVLVEVPQGHGLSLDGPFYPHCTSRNCTVMQAMSDAGIHPQFYGRSMLVLRTFPIRVGNIERAPESLEEFSATDPLLGFSGGHYPDQRETSWDELGQTAEITTVTKRVRRVFTFSRQQAYEAMAASRPDVIYLTFCDYVKRQQDMAAIVDAIQGCARQLGLSPRIVYQDGPSTADLHEVLHYGDRKSCD